MIPKQFNYSFETAVFTISIDESPSQEDQEKPQFYTKKSVEEKTSPFSKFPGYSCVPISFLILHKWREFRSW